MANLSRVVNWREKGQSPAGVVMAVVNGNYQDSVANAKADQSKTIRLIASHGTPVFRLPRGSFK